MTPTDLLLRQKSDFPDQIDILTEDDQVSLTNQTPAKNIENLLRRLITTQIPKSFAYLAIAALTIWIFETFANNQYVPNIQGFTISQSWRILQGQIPHQDFLSAKPVGSGLLHLVDWIIPMRLVSASRLVSTFEIVAYSFLFARVIYRKPLARWTVIQTIGAILATLINVHSFPITAWHTTDGLFCIAAGLVAFRNGAETNSMWRQYLGAVLVGSSILMKQSYAPTFLFALPWLVSGTRPRTKSQWVKLSIAYIAPIGLYSAVISAFGGGPDLVNQIFGVRVPARVLLTPVWHTISDFEGKVVIGGTVALLSAASIFEIKRWQPRFANGAMILRFTLVSLLVFITLPDAIVGTVPNWGKRVFILLIITTVFQLAKRDWKNVQIGLLLIGTSWMVSLSYGYPGPRLIDGAAALCIAQMLLKDIQIPHRFNKDRSLRIATALAVGIAIGTIPVFGDLRTNSNGSTDVPLASVAPDLENVYASKDEAISLQDAAKCISSYPTKYSAVLPAQPGINGIMRLNNPLPVDLFNNVEIGNNQDRVMKAVSKLNHNGNYLILFDNLALKGLDNYSQKSDLFLDPIVNRVYASLSGTHINCGNFKAVYQQS